MAICFVCSIIFGKQSPSVDSMCDKVFTLFVYSANTANNKRMLRARACRFLDTHARATWHVNRAHYVLINYFNSLFNSR